MIKGRMRKILQEISETVEVVAATKTRSVEEIKTRYKEELYQFRYLSIPTPEDHGFHPWVNG